MMRYIAVKLDLRHDQCLIWVDMTKTYITALPHVEHCKNGSGRIYHIRWVEVAAPSTVSIWRWSCSCHETGHTCHKGICPCIAHKFPCSVRCHSENLPTGLPCSGCTRQPVDIALTQPPIPEEYGCENLIEGQSYRYMIGPMFNLCHNQRFQDSRIGGFKMVGTQRTRRNYTTQGSSARACAIRLAQPSTLEFDHALCSFFCRRPTPSDPTFVLIAGSNDDIGLFLRTEQALVQNARQCAQL
jgi:hypothetical protein